MVGLMSLPLTDMRYINGRVVKFYVLCRLAKDFVYIKTTMLNRRFYIIKDEFFIKFSTLNFKTNKNENRPHYYCFKDETDNEIFWMIPLSSKVEKYKKIIEIRSKENKPNDIIHIAILDNNKESVFLIQDMFPITEKYIKRSYTINGQPLVLTSENTAIEIELKASKIMTLLKRGIKLNKEQTNVNKIIRFLKEEAK